MRKTALALAVPLSMLSASCQSIVSTPPANCLEFIPDGWKQPVPGAPIPDFAAVDAITDPDPVVEALKRAEAEARVWQKDSLATSGQLTIANGRQADTLHLIAVCERNANKARPRRKVLGLF